jgi:hypothetical protein
MYSFSKLANVINELGKVGKLFELGFPFIYFGLFTLGRSATLSEGETPGSASRGGSSVWVFKEPYPGYETF